MVEPAKWEDILEEKMARRYFLKNEKFDLVE